MKRHNFKGQGAAHGNHKKHRSPGSIGACATPGPGLQGDHAWRAAWAAHQVTTLNLEVVQADAERELILVQGAVPGPRGGMVVLRDTVKGTNGVRPVMTIATATRSRRASVAGSGPSPSTAPSSAGASTAP